MVEAFLCDYIRTPIGRFGGALSTVRTDDLAAAVLREIVAKIFDSVTAAGARALGLKDYGIAPGKRADFVVLQARNVMEAVRLKPPRLFVVRSGKIIARANPTRSILHINGDEKNADFTLARD